MDWGKYQYEQEKHLQKSRKKQKVIEIKQIRIGLKTDSHDIDTKIRAAQKFLAQGHKVKVNLRFKGREITHPELGKNILTSFCEKLESIATKETEFVLNGRELSIILTGKKDAKTKNQQDSSKES